MHLLSFISWIWSWKRRSRQFFFILNLTLLFRWPIKSFMLIYKLDVCRIYFDRLFRILPRLTDIPCNIIRPNKRLFNLFLIFDKRVSVPLAINFRLCMVRDLHQFNLPEDVRADTSKLIRIKPRILPRNVSGPLGVLLLSMINTRFHIPLVDFFRTFLLQGREQIRVGSMVLKQNLMDSILNFLWGIFVSHMPLKSGMPILLLVVHHVDVCHYGRCFFQTLLIRVIHLRFLLRLERSLEEFLVDFSHFKLYFTLYLTFLILDIKLLNARTLIKHRFWLLIFRATAKSLETFQTWWGLIGEIGIFLIFLVLGLLDDILLE